MRKWMSLCLFVLIFSLLTGCSGADVLEKTRLAYSRQSRISLELSMVVSGEQLAAPYTISQVQGDKTAEFTVLAPAEISGITATVTEEGLTFGGALMSSQSLPQGYTPFDLAYFAVEALRDDRPATAGRELVDGKECFLISKDVVVYEKVLKVNLWLDAATYQLVKYEFFDDGNRVLEANVLKFEAEPK